MCVAQGVSSSDDTATILTAMRTFARDVTVATNGLTALLWSLRTKAERDAAAAAGVLEAVIDALHAHRHHQGEHRARTFSVSFCLGFWILLRWSFFFPFLFLLRVSVSHSRCQFTSGCSRMCMCLCVCVWFWLFPVSHRRAGGGCGHVPHLAGH